MLKIQTSGPKENPPTASLPTNTDEGLISRTVVIWAREDPSLRGTWSAPVRGRDSERRVTSTRTAKTTRMVSAASAAAGPQRTPASTQPPRLHMGLPTRRGQGGCDAAVWRLLGAAHFDSDGAAVGGFPGRFRRAVGGCGLSGLLSELRA